MSIAGASQIKQADVRGEGIVPVSILPEMQGRIGDCQNVFLAKVKLGCRGYQGTTETGYKS